MSGRQSELTDCNPTTITGTTACGVGDSWVWVWVCSGGIDVDVADGIVPKLSEAAIDDVMDEAGGTDVVVGAAPPGTKPCLKFAISRRGGMTGGKRYNLHQLILPDASILPEPMVGVRELFNTGFEACLAEWKSKDLV